MEDGCPINTSQDTHDRLDLQKPAWRPKNANMTDLCITMPKFDLMNKLSNDSSTIIGL